MRCIVCVRTHVRVRACACVCVRACVRACVRVCTGPELTKVQDTVTIYPRYVYACVPCSLA